MESLKKHHKTLTEIKGFRIVSFVFALIAILTSLFIVTTSDLTYSPGYLGLNNLLEIFKVPITILFWSFPFLAIVVANHRSVQTRDLIKYQLTHNDMSVKPLLNLSTNLQSEQLSVSIVNKGNGTAVVKKVVINDAEGNEFSIEEFFEKLNDFHIYNFELNGFVIMEDTAIAKDECLTLVNFNFPDYEDDISLKLYADLEAHYKSFVNYLDNRFKISIEYVSLYESKSKLEANIFFIK